MKKLLTILAVPALIIFILSISVQAHDTGSPGFSPYSVFDKTATPTVNDDLSKGFTPGSLWVNVTNDTEYVCVDDTIAAAVWTETTQGPGGSDTHIQFNDDGVFGGHENLVTDKAGSISATSGTFSGTIAANGDSITSDGSLSINASSVAVVIGSGAGDSFSINNGSDILLIDGNTGISTFTGNVEISKEIPTLSITDTGDGNSATMSRTEIDAVFQLTNTVFRPGGTTNALDFDGTNDRVSAGSGLLLGTSSDLSFSIWINAVALPINVFQRILLQSKIVAGIEWHFTPGSSPAPGLHFIVDNGSEHVIQTTMVATSLQGAWHHIAGTYSDGNTPKIYVDGVDVSKASSSAGFGDDANNDFIIGARPSVGSQFYEGLIDELAVWSEELSANDISDLYAGGSGVQIDPSDNFPTDGGSMGTGLEGLWHHNESEMNSAPGGTDTEDSSGNGNHGTASGMTDDDFVLGKILLSGSDQEISIINCKDGVASLEKGICTFGDSDGKNISDGKTQEFHIAGGKITDIDENGTWTIDNGDATAQQLILRAAAGASENIQEWRLSDETVVVNVTEAGSVGIGDSDPEYQLHMQSASNTDMLIETTNVNGLAGIRFRNDAQEWRFNVGAADNFTVIDVTGRKTPFTLENGAPANTLRLESGGESLFGGKVAFTQTDFNEFIDSLADGYLDYSATTAHRFNMSTADTDIRMEFVGTTNSGLFTWMEDEDYFLFGDDLLIDSAEKIFLRDTAIGTYSQADGFFDIFADGGTRIGDSSSGAPTNYTNFAPDGELTLVGTARIMRSMDFEPEAVKQGGVGPGASTEDSFPIHDYSAVNDESVFIHWEIPHDYASAGEIHLHAEYFVDTAPASEEFVTWGVEYKKLTIGDNFDFGAGTTTSTVNDAITSGTPANDKKIHSSPEIQLITTGFEPMDVILIRFFRDANASEGGATDNFGSDARLFNYHLMYLSDKLGEAS